ncbi:MULTISPECIES: hypothetical protein [Pseudomonas]|uniref:hypothetical protein n=1 Tax=Pseudomonas TaxID=286 RepID=UPI0023615821|nr:MULTISPECIES: hypothetical protein [Pseudomonas]WJV24475.1 hypothetical protein PSR66_00015 [Pseudomonas chlororaphis]
MLMQTREYRPIGALPNSHPVKFEVSPFSLHVNIGQPYTKMAVKLDQLHFEEATMTFDKIPVVNVAGGSDSNLFWKIALKPEDAADLKALIAEILEAAKSL